MKATRTIKLTVTGDEFDYLTMALGFQLEHDDGTEQPPKESGETVLQKLVEAWSER